jgi:multiple sugar transport system substrate-binding protein
MADDMTRSSGDETELRGIAWAHTRATGPLQVTAQAFADFRPGVRITWDTRSLWAFGEASLDDLIDRYDLIVLDHPMIGHAVERGLLLPLDGHVPAAWLDDQAAHAVGGSHDSYRYDGRQWAAAIDAACPVAVARDDLLEQAGAERPTAWDEVLALARSTGRVVVPLKQIDALSLFFTLCANQGEPALDLATGRVVSDELGLQVLAQMRELLDAVGAPCLDRSPIDVLAAMSSSDDVLFCPHAYGYTNYAREGYGRSRVAFHDFCGPGRPAHAGTTLGGAGLAVSARTRRAELAFEYLGWAASPECQRTTYVLAGGQPGHAAAWDDETANAITGGFFRNTRRTIESAYVRPNHPGMHDFQASAGAAVRSFLLGSVDAPEALAAVGRAFRESLPPS